MSNLFSSDELEREKEKVANENRDLSSRLEVTQNKLTAQTALMEDEIDSLKLDKARADTQLDELKANAVILAKKARKDYEEIEDKLISEREEVKESLVKSHKAEVVRLIAEKASQIEALRAEVSDLQGALHRARQKHSEELQQAEMAREQAVALHGHEKAAMEEQNNDLVQELDESR